MFALTVHVHEIFPSTLFLLILKVFYFGIFNAFFYFLYSFMKMKAYTVCARAQASIFMVFWPFSPKKKIVKLLKKSERWPNKWSKVKTLEDKPRSGWPFFHKLCEKYYRKSCKFMPNNSTKQKGKKISTLHYRSKFRAQRYEDKLPKKVGKPWREKGGAYFMQAWCQEDLQTLYQRRTGRQTHLMWTP